MAHRGGVRGLAAAGAAGRRLRGAATGGPLAVAHGLQGRGKGPAGWTDAPNLHVGSAGPAGPGIRGNTRPLVVNASACRLPGRLPLRVSSGKEGTRAVSSGLFRLSRARAVVHLPPA